MSLNTGALIPDGAIANTIVSSWAISISLTLFPYYVDHRTELQRVQNSCCFEHGIPPPAQLFYLIVYTVI